MAVERKVGFVGLGQMGRWMATNLVKSGYPVTVFNRTAAKTKPLEELGAIRVQSPSEVAARSDLVFLSLPDTQAVERVIFGHRGIVEGAKPDTVVVDLSTISYRATLDIARRLNDRGLRFADAPVSGMEARAREGKLTVMFGGEESLFKDLGPYFDVIGDTVIYMGAVGSGQLAKLINQLLFNTAMASMAELLPLAVKLGLDPEKVTEVVTTGTGRSFGVEFFAPRILENRFDGGYPLAKAYKDMVSAAEISANERIPLPMVQAAMTAFQVALAQGLGDEDKGSLIKVYERLLGVEFRKRKASDPGHDS